MNDAATIWQHAQIISGSFDSNYYGLVVSGAWVTPKLSLDNSTEKVTFLPFISHCAQKNKVTAMKLA